MTDQKIHTKEATSQTLVVDSSFHIHAASSAEFKAVAAVAPKELQAPILKAEPVLRKLHYAVLHACATDQEPVGPRVGIVDVPETTLKALASGELKRRDRNRERVWWIVGSIGVALTAVVTALISVGAIELS